MDQDQSIISCTSWLCFGIILDKISQTQIQVCVMQCELTFMLHAAQIFVSH